METSAAMQAGPRTKVTSCAFNDTFSVLAAVASLYILLPRSGLQYDNVPVSHMGWDSDVERALMDAWVSTH